ncbi:TPA: hypothetical protein UZ441_004831 [Escherichia coli]|nr:major capsid protein [Escherichia coli]HEL8025987.1 hypothetical protein [Escherichia coli]HEL8044704.1 hypothetical protein [Escherichia coli]HEL8049403.1 hypothetical protein [Escherichia coli]HEL8054248.1 hypothetical protein [Escherichia coli]
MFNRVKSFFSRGVTAVKEKFLAFSLPVLALGASGSALASSSSSTVDFSSLQTAIDFTSIIAIVLAVGAAAVGVYIAYTGVSMVLKSIKKAG